MSHLTYNDMVNKHNKTVYGGQSKIEKVGRQKYIVSREDKLDRYGNPVYRAGAIDKDGTTFANVRTTGGEARALYESYKKVNNIKPVTRLPAKKTIDNKGKKNKSDGTR